MPTKPKPRPVETGEVELLPASSLIPEAFTDRDKVYWSQRDIPKGESRKIFLMSAFDSGYRYFTLNRQVRLSRERPVGWEDEISYKMHHGPGKTDRDGNPMEEKDYPRNIWIAKIWIVEEERCVCAIIDSAVLQKRIAKQMRNEEFGMLPCGITNFYLTIDHEANPKSPQDTYDATASMRKLNNERAMEEAAKPFFPEAFWKGLNPLEEPTEPVEEEDKPRPPVTAQDSNGADEVLEENDLNEDGEAEYKW